MPGEAPSWRGEGAAIEPAPKVPPARVSAHGRAAPLDGYCCEGRTGRFRTVRTVTIPIPAISRK